MNSENLFKEFIKTHSLTQNFLENNKKKLAKIHYLKLHELYARLEQEDASIAIKELAHNQLTTIFNKLQ